MAIGTQIQHIMAWMAMHIHVCGAWIVVAFYACGAWLAVRLAQLVTWGHFPIILMVFVQLAGSGMQVWTKEVIMDYDLRPFILVFLRQIVSSVVLSPATYLERNTRPPLTCWIFFQIVWCSLLGIVANQCFFITGLKYTSSSKASAIANLLPVVTWIMGLLVGQETLTQLTTVHGHRKIVGTLGCVGGAIIIATVKGPTILHKSGLFSHWFEHGAYAEESALGLLYVSFSCLSAAIWFTLLAHLKNTYNAPLTTTCLTSCISIFPLGVIAISSQHNMEVWRAMGTMEYGLAFYSGAIGTAVSVYLINLCINLRGSHFVASFSPSSLIVVIILGWIFTHDSIYLGGFLGSIVLLAGLSFALLGMNGERADENEEDQDQV